MPIGKTIATYRKKLNYTQKELATELNVSDKTISSWENERTYPYISMIIQLSDLLNLSLDELLREDTMMVEEIDTTIKAGKFYQRWKKLILAMLIFILAFASLNLVWFSWKQYRLNKIERYQADFMPAEWEYKDLYLLSIEDNLEIGADYYVKPNYFITIENYNAFPYLWFKTLVTDFSVDYATYETLSFIDKDQLLLQSMRGYTLYFTPDLTPISGNNFGEELSKNEITEFLKEEAFDLRRLIDTVMPVFEELY